MPPATVRVYSPHAGAMGEAWSDWYAFDELGRGGNLVDAPGVADVRLGAYESGTQNLIRSEPIDCRVGVSDPACPGSLTAGSGGYTFGDFGKVLGFPEVHADGEIWVQTLWQLRDALIDAHGTTAGIARAEQLVTDAMRLSPERAVVPRPAQRDPPGRRDRRSGAAGPRPHLAGVRLTRHGLVRLGRLELRRDADRGLLAAAGAGRRQRDGPGRRQHRRRRAGRA